MLEYFIKMAPRGLVIRYGNRRLYYSDTPIDLDTSYTRPYLQPYMPAPKCYHYQVLWYDEETGDIDTDGEAGVMYDSWDLLRDLPFDVFTIEQYPQTHIYRRQ